MPDYHTLRINSIAPSSVGANSYILILQSIENSTLAFPIVIGSQEAQSISIFIEGISINRPLTHDLFISLIKSINLELDYVSITSFKDGVFYAELHVDNLEKHIIDSRPSDAIAIALRLQKEIRISDKLLKSICIDSDDVSIEKDETFEFKSLTELEYELNMALKSENYEQAAFIRDQIEKLNTKNEK